MEVTGGEEEKEDGFTSLVSIPPGDAFPNASVGLDTEEEKTDSDRSSFPTPDIFPVGGGEQQPSNPNVLGGRRKRRIRSLLKRVKKKDGEKIQQDHLQEEGVYRGSMDLSRDESEVNSYTPLLCPEEGLHFGSVPRGETETLDYDPIENTLQNQREIEKQGESKGKYQMFRVGVELSVALLTGALGVICTFFSKSLNETKFEAASGFLDPKEETNPQVWAAYLVMLSFNVVFAFLAAMTVVVLDPHTRGSGVPEIKAFLNGVRIPNVLGFRALVSKVTGVIFSVPSGLIIGKEGPMIHIGAVIGSLVCQTKMVNFLPARQLPKQLLDLRDDEKTRDFVSLGGACGVAAAFGAPIGGVLQIEELHSFWSAIITWRTFFATMITTITMFSILTIMRGSPGYLSHDSLIAFGSFEGASKKPDYPIQPGYNMLELLIFILMGVIGGLIGAGFNAANLFIVRFREKFKTSSMGRVGEVVALSVLTTSLVFALCWSSPCLPTPSCPPFDSDEICNGVCCDQPDLPLKAFNCEVGAYNPMATLIYSPLDQSVQHLFHSCRHIPYPTLALFFVTTLFLGCVTYGANVPSGVFVPCMVSGGAFGRIIGELVAANATWEEVTDPGTFALIGAAALLGGVSRMTISNAVILLEVTDDFTYSIPVIAVTLAARFTGDIFNKGLYASYVDLLNISYLSRHKRFLTALRASDIMESPPIVFREVESVRRLTEVLSTTTANGFPVIRAGKGTFQGLIRRDQIAILLKHRCFQKSPKRLIRADKVSPFISVPSNLEGLIDIRDLEPDEAPRLSWADFREYYPDFPVIDEIQLYPGDLEMFIDLTPYMNLSAFSVHHSTHALRIHRLFRAMGLRHLTVVNSKNKVEGIITRRHLTIQKAKNRFHAETYEPDIVNNDEWH